MCCWQKRPILSIQGKRAASVAWPVHFNSPHYNALSRGASQQKARYALSLQNTSTFLFSSCIRAHKHVSGGFFALSDVCSEGKSENSRWEDLLILAAYALLLL